VDIFGHDYPRGKWVVYAATVVGLEPGLQLDFIPWDDGTAPSVRPKPGDYLQIEWHPSTGVSATTVSDAAGLIEIDAEGDRWLIRPAVPSDRLNLYPFGKPIRRFFVVRRA
jgi:hypothetical protein